MGVSPLMGAADLWWYGRLPGGVSAGVVASGISVMNSTMLMNMIFFFVIQTMLLFFRSVPFFST